MASAASYELLGETVLKGLGDRLLEKRKQAANEIEAKVRTVLLDSPTGRDYVHRIISCLHRDLIDSRQRDQKKGGLQAFASVAVACGDEIQHFLQQLLPPVLCSFQDDEVRVKYYACEAVLNIYNVAGKLLLPYFNQIFDAILKCHIDPDNDLRSAAVLVDQKLQELVMNHGDQFGTAEFVLQLATWVKIKSPPVRLSLLSWIRMLLDIPQTHMVSCAPHYLDVVFTMLPDQTRDIRQTAHALLRDLLSKVTSSSHESALQIISSTTGILVKICYAHDACSRIVALYWLHDYVAIQMNKAPADLEHNEVRLAEAAELSSRGSDEQNRSKYQHQLCESWMASLPELVGGTLHCIDDREEEIARVAVQMDGALLDMVQSLKEEIPVDPLVERMIRSMQERESMTVRVTCMQWICMLLNHSPAQMLRHPTLPRLFDPIFRTLSLSDEEVVVAAVQVLAMIMGARNRDEDRLNDGAWPFREEEDSTGDLFSVVTEKLLRLFAAERSVLADRGRLMIRHLCGHLDPRRLYVTVARAIKQEKDLEFAQQLVQTFSWILFTATETRNLREELLTAPVNLLQQAGQAPAGRLFLELLEPWFHNPVSALALCLLAQQDDLAFELTARFAAFEPTIDLLKQLDQLVQLLESPMFSRMRLRLLEPAKHPALVKCILALAMILPRASAFNLLRERILVIQSGLLLEARAPRLQNNASGDGLQKAATWSGARRMLCWSEGQPQSNRQPGDPNTKMASLLLKFNATAAAAAPGR